MEKLKRTICILALILILAAGCKSTKIFEIKSLNEELHIIEIDSERITQRCYFLNAEKENNWRHQYVLSMLNDKKEVLPVFFPTNHGPDECSAHLKKVEKVLKSSTKVRLCVRDKIELRTPSDVILNDNDFGKLGVFKSTYYALTFDRICNSSDCVSISDTWTETCPKLFP